MKKVLIMMLTLVLLWGCSDKEDVVTTTATTAATESTTEALPPTESIKITSLEQLEGMGDYDELSEAEKEAAAQFVYGLESADIVRYIDMFYLANATGRAKVETNGLNGDGIKNAPGHIYEIIIETENTDEKALESCFEDFCRLTEKNIVTRLSVAELTVSFASDIGKFEDTVIKTFSTRWGNSVR